SRGSIAEGGGMEIPYITADDIIKDNDITYIKADVEGAECSFINGAKNIIRSKKPEMMISCYHRSDDLYTIPEAVLNLRDDYKVYIRHFPSIPAWDTVYLFV
ncbi:MAG: FkbM family methyltransferase, partial [Clostridia bacterium]|nr:FkbM family methyltransferase [Clostridia bacterium]